MDIREVSKITYRVIQRKLDPHLILKSRGSHSRPSHPSFPSRPSPHPSPPPHPSFPSHPTFPSRPSPSPSHPSVRRTTPSPNRPFPPRPTPSSSRPRPTRPIPTRPTPTRPIPTRPFPTRPIPTRPRPSPTRPLPPRPHPTNPIPTRPTPTRPIPTRPNPTRPVPTGPNPTRPIPTRPRPFPTRPVPTRPLPPRTHPTNPIPTRPTPTRPIPTRPVPTGPNPTRPIPTRPRPTPTRYVRPQPTIANTPRPLPTIKTPPNIGWNKDIVKPTTISNANSPWIIPGRESPYQKGIVGGVQAPPNGGAIGWRPEVNNTRKVIGQQHTGPPPLYPRQEYGSAYQPGYNPGTYGYQPRFGNGGHTTTIINNNYHHTANYQPPPVYYPRYYYSSRDTGDSSLGLYLGHVLGRVSSPTYHHHGLDHHTYRPVYDHYAIHYYHHNVHSAPRQEVIQPNAIVECGDSRTICPVGTHALCTSSGSVMCVADVIYTRPCTDVRQANCTSVLIPCGNDASAECRGKTPQESIYVDIPCMYTAKVLGRITYVNDTIVSIPSPPLQNEAASWLINSATPTPIWDISTQYPITTIPPPFSTPQMRSQLPPQQVHQFCVTIIARPAKRTNLTESEILFQNTKTLAAKFLVRTIGANRGQLGD